LTSQPNVAGVLLAAGQGSRLGQPKALIVVGGQSLARRGIELLHAGGATPVVVVTGAAGPGALGPPGPGAGGSPAGPAELSAGSGPDVITAHNPDWASGMGSSLAVGLAAAPASCDAAVIALADQPLVGPDSVRRLIAACRDGASVAVACYHGRLRNPVLIGRVHWAEVAALAAGDVGARQFLRAHPELVTAVECGDTGRPDDIDTPEDLARLEQLLAASAGLDG
jgi:CTP:molybdopterin cytidylyltransferase MocA